MLDSLKRDILMRQQAKEMSIMEESLVMMAVRESFGANDGDISDEDLDRLLEEIPEDNSEEEVSAPNGLDGYGDLLDDEVEEAVQEGAAIDDASVNAPGKMDSDPAAKKAEMDEDTEKVTPNVKPVAEASAIEDVTVKASGKMDADPAAKKAEMEEDTEVAPLEEGLLSGIRNAINTVNGDKAKARDIVRDLNSAIATESNPKYKEEYKALKAKVLDDLNHGKLVTEGAIDDASVKAPGKMDSDPAAKKAEMEEDAEVANVNLKPVAEASAIEDVTVKASGKMDADPAAKKAEMTEDTEVATPNVKPVAEASVADEELQKRLKAKGVCGASAIEDVTVKASGKMDADPAAKKAEMTEDTEIAPLEEGLFATIRANRKEKATEKALDWERKQTEKLVKNVPVGELKKQVKLFEDNLKEETDPIMKKRLRIALDAVKDELDNRGVVVTESTAMDDVSVKAPGKMDSDSAAKKAEMEEDTEVAPIETEIKNQNDTMLCKKCGKLKTQCHCCGEAVKESVLESLLSALGE